MSNYNCSETVLQDVSSTGRVRPWLLRKNEALEIADSYYRNGDLLREKKIRNCGTRLYFAHYSDGSRKLANALFCKSRLCSLCNWRKSLLIYHQTLEMMDYITKEKKSIRYLFLTLTLKNCNIYEIEKTLDHYQVSLNRFLRRKEWNCLQGSFYAYEVTVNKFTGMLHPHIHLILAVNSNYFSKNYISHEKLVAMWRSCAMVDYDPIIDIRPFRKSVSKAVAEASKYTVKGSDLLHWDSELQDLIVDALDSAFYGRRLIGYRGIFKDVRKKLNMVDVENADLTDLNIAEKDEKKLTVLFIECYSFRIGVNGQRNYYLDSVEAASGL